MRSKNIKNFLKKPIDKRCGVVYNIIRKESRNVYVLTFSVQRKG